KRFDIFAPDFFSVAVAQHRFEHNSDAHRQARNFPDFLFFEGRQRIEPAFRAFAGLEFPQRFKFVTHACCHSERSATESRNPAMLALRSRSGMSRLRST